MVDPGDSIDIDQLSEEQLFKLDLRVIHRIRQLRKAKAKQGVLAPAMQTRPALSSTWSRSIAPSRVHQGNDQGS